MRVLVTGSRGLIGSALMPALQNAGHTTTPLLRGKVAGHEVTWDPAAPLDTNKVLAIDAVVHLAGENISGRWTAKKKARIRNSRVQGTRTLADALARCEPPPKVMVVASAVGYYGSRGAELLTEESAPGADFLASVCLENEAAALPATQVGARVVALRIGLVLSARGGGLAKMLPPFRMGLGGPMGKGNQYWSWIAIDDVVGIIQHAIVTESLRGPVNTVAPNPVTNAEFARSLGQVLHRPAFFPMPEFMVNLAFGEMGTSLLLASQRVSSAKLEASGFKFRYPALRGALEELLHAS